MSHLDEGTIHAWLDGALSPDESRAVEAHIAGCADCSAAVAEARGLMAAASRILTTLDNVPAGVIPPSASAPSRKKVVARPRRWFTPRIAAAAALMFVAAGTYVASSVERRAPSVEGLMTDEGVPAMAPAPENLVVIADSAAARPVASDRAAIASPEAAASAPMDAAGPVAKAGEEARLSRQSAQPVLRAPAPLPVPPTDSVETLERSAVAQDAPSRFREFERRSDAAAAPPALAAPAASLQRSPNVRQLTPRRMGGMAGARPRELEGQAAGFDLRGERAALSEKAEKESARAKRPNEAIPLRDSARRMEQVVTTGAAAASNALAATAAVPSKTDAAATLLRYAGCYRLSAWAALGDTLAPLVPVRIALDTMRVNPNEGNPPLYRVRLLPPIAASDYDEVTWAPDTNSVGFELYWRAGITERGVVFGQRSGIFTGTLREWPMLSLRSPIVTVSARALRCVSR